MGLILAGTGKTVFAKKKISIYCKFWATLCTGSKDSP